MRLETAKAIFEAAQGSEHEVKLYPDYSGRGMMGKTTAAIVCRSFIGLLPAVAVAGCNFASEYSGFDEFCDDLKSLRTDNYGNDVVVY